MTTTSAGETFWMVIQEIVSLTNRPGLHLYGEIESGEILIDDHISLVDGEQIIREVACDDINFMDQISEPRRTLVAGHVRSLRPGDVQQGQVLVGT